MKMVKTLNKQERKVSIEYHADDFGMFPTQSRRILECHYNGRLNGVSVMPNSDYLKECMELLRPVQNDVAVTIHLNIIEGHSVCECTEVPLLTDEKGIFRCSFGGLLLHSFLPGREAYREQLKKEIRAQIYTVLPFLPGDAPIRIDGHAHYHMIPVVFDALMDVIREEQLAVSYIRVPREYVTLYLRHWRELQDFSPINLVKVLILNHLAAYNLRKYREDAAMLSQTVFLGVLLSGRMHRENVAPILPDATALAQKMDKRIEILAHPGGIYEASDIAQLTNMDDITFLTSEMRQKEASLFEAFADREAIAL